MEYVQLLATIASALLSGSFVGFLEFMIRRHDEKKGKGKELLGAVKKIDLKLSTLEDRIQKMRKKQMSETRRHGVSGY